MVNGQLARALDQFTQRPRTKWLAGARAERGSDESDYLKGKRIMNFWLKQLGQGIAVAASMAAAGAAYSAEDGQLGTTSTGTLDVAVEVEDRVQISGLNDIPFGTYSGTGNLRSSDGFCVYRNGTGLYSLQVESAHPDGDTFRLSTRGGPVRPTRPNRPSPGTDTTFIPYSVIINGVLISHGEVVNGTGSAISATCSGEINAEVAVEVAASDLQAAPSGSYEDTITLTLSPR